MDPNDGLLPDSSDSDNEVEAQEADVNIDEQVLFNSILLGIQSELGPPACPRQNSPPHVTENVLWDEHVSRLRNRGLFYQYYKMGETAFDVLCQHLAPHMNTNRNGERGRRPSKVEIRVHCYLRYIYGGNYLDIVQPFDVHPSSFYRYIWECVDAVNAAAQLAVNFPTSRQALDMAVDNFARKSTQEVLRGVIGALDGLHVRITAPRASDGLRNVRSHYSGERSAVGQSVDLEHISQMAYRCRTPNCSCNGHERRCPNFRCPGMS